ncbi:MAG: matrixin family metalloprotease [Polyangiaceae bacterium]
MTASAATMLASTVETVIAKRESIAESGALAGLPITTITLREPRGTTREIRIVGGTNAHGGRTWLAETGIPDLGAVVSGDPRDWKHDYVPGSPPSTWPSGKLPVPFTFQIADPRGLGESAFPEFDIAERAWSHVSCTAFRASLTARANVTAADDGVNAVIWHDDVWPSELVVEKLGQVVISTYAMGNYEDVDIHMNGADYTWSLDGAGDTVDARGVYTHELGHALGLGHTSDTTATMYAADPGSESWRSLESDDDDGVCALYPGGTGAPGCDTGAACPSGYACVAQNCERLGEEAGVCSPCVREVGACAGAGEDARCIDIGSGASMGRVCGRKCATDPDCGGGFHCLATTTSGDLQCVSDDACATGPDPCTTDADCHGDGTCKSNACVGAEPADADAGLIGSDAGSGANPATTTSSGGCTLSPRSGANEGRWTFVFFLSLALRKRKKFAGKKMATALLAALIGLSTSACDKKTDLAPQHPTTPSPIVPGDTDEHGQTSCKNVVARIDSLGMRPGKPPQQIFYFDVRLHNPSNEARWIVLPPTFTYDGKDTPAPGKGTVSGLSAVVLSGRGKLVWVSMSDPGGFHGVLLPPHANVTLRNLPVDAWWQTKHKTGKLDVILAKSIAIDEKPLESFIKGDLKSEDDADAALDADPRDTRIVDKSVSGTDSHAVTFEEDCTGYGQAILKMEEPSSSVF